ncbi:MAG: hypothetical protein P8J17_04140 [Halioglobus sp.]|nr:hypothetical protein [Halioglobus sp.]
MLAFLAGASGGEFSRVLLAGFGVSGGDFKAAALLGAASHAEQKRSDQLWLILTNTAQEPQIFQNLALLSAVELTANDSKNINPAKA